MPYDDGAAVLAKSGEDVTDFPHQYRPFKSPINLDLCPACVRFVRVRGINRQVVGNEKVLQERSSEPS